MTRTEAARAGERFFTSRPCRHDGDTRRYVASYHCVTCSKRRGEAQQKAIRAALAAAKAL